VERKPGLPSTTQTRPVLGVIDALSAGFDAVLRHPWLLLIPVLLDLWLWIGPRLHAPDLYQFFAPTLRQMMRQMTTSESRYAAQELNKAVEQFFTQFNLLAWLSIGLIGVPIVNGGIWATVNLVTGAAPLLWRVDTFEGYVAVFVLASAIGLLIAASYWTLLGDYVRGEAFLAGRWLKRSLLVWKSLLVLALIVIGLIVISLFPLSMLMLTIGVFSPELASFVPLVALGLAVWSVLVCLFTPHGLVVYHMPLSRAINTSILIVRANFAPVTGLVALALALSLGMGLIWDGLAADSWLRLIAMAGNALVGTGLIMASLLFYQNRVLILFESHHWPLPAGRY
jgi:hypothetical protein